MTNKTLNCIIFILSSLCIQAQEIQFEQHVISDSFVDGFDIVASDINQDGYMDILACGKGGGGQVCWWKNNGDNTFQMITIKQGSFTGARSVRAADVNGDMDIDIVSAAWQANKIIFFENDGNESFTEHVVDSYFSGAHTVDLKDVDGDGDPDILCSAWDYFGHNGEIAWWENDGGDSISWTKNLISARFQQSPFIYGEDMDNDGDIDVLACGELNDEILWWENDGTGQFTGEYMIDSDFNSAHTVLAKDVDLDDDMDILAAGCMNSKLAWYENDGNQLFTKHNLTPIGGDLWLDAVDLDNDGDNDLIAAGMSSSKLKWFENDGNQQFIRHDIDGGFTSGFAIVPVNMDADGDIDLLAIGKTSDMISWFENDLDSITGVSENALIEENKIRVYPNPANEYLNIFDQQSRAKHICIFNSSGKLLRRLKSVDRNTSIWIGSMPKGMLIIKISYNENNIYSYKVINH